MRGRFKTQYVTGGASTWTYIKDKERQRDWEMRLYLMHTTYIFPLITCGSHTFEDEDEGERKDAYMR